MTSALSKVPTLGEGVMAGGSKNSDGTEWVPYQSGDNDAYLWFKVPMEFYSVSFTAGENMSLSSGSATQTVTNGETIAEVEYKAAEGYHFPANGTVVCGDAVIDAGSVINGVTLTLSEDGTTLTISGAPQADLQITLNDAAANTYRVSFDGTDATSGSMEAQDFTYGVLQALSKNGFSRKINVTYAYNGGVEENDTAYDTAASAFGGWSRKAGGDKLYDDEEEVINLSSSDGDILELYALWTDVSIMLPSPSKPGSVFEGWYSDESLDTFVGSGGDLYTPKTDCTLYAKYSQNGIAIAEIDDMTYSGADNSTVTATAVCGNDPSHVVTETVKTSYKVTLEPIADRNGVGLYTAEFENELFETQTREVVLPSASRPLPPVSDLNVSPAPNDAVKPDESASGLPFTDVTKDMDCYEDVKYVYENGIMVGASDTLFGPGLELSRAMLVTILWRMEGEPEVEYSGVFSDVPEGAWFTKGVEWAASKGIVLGRGDGTFGVNDPLTREQLAVILFRYAKWKEYDVSVGEDTNILGYYDAFDISAWAMPAMQWACGSGVLTDNAGWIRPADPATRAEIARAIHVFMENVAE